MAFGDNLGKGSFDFSFLKQPTSPQTGLGDPDYSIGRAGTNEQFPEAAAYARTEDNIRQAQKVAATFEKMGIEVPDNIRVLAEEGYEPDEPGFFGKVVSSIAGNPVGGGVFKVLNVLGGPGRLIQTGLKWTTEKLTGTDYLREENMKGKDWWNVFWGDPEKMQDLALRTNIDVTNGSQMLAMWGWEEADSFGGKAGRFLAHLGLEVLTDPLSYISMGAGGVGRKALGEGADAAIDRVVREAVEGTGTKAVHQQVLSRIDDLTDQVAAKFYDGDIDTIARVAGDSLDKKAIKDLQKLLEAGDPAAEGFLYDKAYQLVTGKFSQFDEAASSAWDVGMIGKELRDEIVGPAISRDFASLPREWLDELPAYARGGMRIITPFSVTQSQLKRGWQIPGTRGVGRDVWEATGQKFTKRLREAPMPFANSKTIGDIFGSISKHTDYTRTLTRGVREGTITGGEYMLIQDAMQHSVISKQIDEVQNRLHFSFNDIGQDFEAEFRKSADLVGDTAGLSEKELRRDMQREYARSMYDFITGDGKELRVRGQVIKSGPLYEKATEFRNWSRSVMDEYNDAIKKALGPEYTGGIENYLPFNVGMKQQAFLRALAEKASADVNKMAKSGRAQGADYYVAALINSIGHGGPTEASMGSSAYLNPRNFTSSPMVQMMDGQPLVMISKDLKEDVARFLESVEASEIGASEFNDLVEGKLRHLAEKYNVPLPDDAAGARVFQEDPFELINGYVTSMENTLRQRNAIEIMKEYGLVKGVDRQIAVQQTLNQIALRAQNPKFQKSIERIAQKQALREETTPGWFDIVQSGKATEAAEHVRLSLTQYDERGFATKLYDRPVRRQEIFDRYMGNDLEGGNLTIYRGWSPQAPGNPILDPYNPTRNIRAMREGREVQGAINVPRTNYRKAPWFGSLRERKDGKWDLKLSDGTTGTFDSEEEVMAEIARLERLTNPALAESGVAVVPRVPHAGTLQSTLDLYSTSDRFTEFTFKGAKVFDRTVTDAEANVIQETMDYWAQVGMSEMSMREFFEMAYDGGLAGMRSGLDENISHMFTKDEWMSFADDIDLVAYRNSAEDKTSLSYIILNDRAIESSRLINASRGENTVAFYDRLEGRFVRRPDPKAVQEDPWRFSEVAYDATERNYRLNLMGADVLDPAERSIIQRDLLRFAEARQHGGLVEIIAPGRGQKLWSGKASEVTRMTDQEALGDVAAAIGFIERGLDIPEEFAAKKLLTGQVARAFRKWKKRGGQAFDPNRKGMADVPESEFYEIIFDTTTGKHRWHSGALAELGPNEVRVGVLDLDTEGMMGRLDFKVPKRNLKAAKSKVYNQADIYDEARWLSKRGGMGRLGAQDTERNLALNYDFEDLSGYRDWDAVDDVDVYAAATADIATRHLDGNAGDRHAFLAWAREEYGAEFVERATKTPRDILAAEKANYDFMDALYRLFGYGREDAGDILPTTVFYAGREDPFGELLAHTRKMAKAIGIDPDTFEPSYTAIANQTYEFIHPVTGVAVQRNLVNPRLFGVGGPAVEGVVIERELAEWFSVVAQNAASMYTPVGFAAFKSGADQVIRWWKSMATITRPTFHIRNLMGGLWNNQIVGVGLRDYATVRNGAIKIRNLMDQGKTIEEAIEFLTPKQGKVFKAAFEEGVMQSSFSTTELSLKRDKLTRTKMQGALKAVNPLSGEGFGVRIGSNFMESIEDFMRMSAFAAWYDPSNPATAKAAREMALAVHFDYAHLTKFESRVKDFVPFFVWQRRNIPLQLQVLAERPGLMTRYAHLMEAFDENFGSDEGQGADLPGSEYWTGFAADTGAVLNENTPYWARLMLDPQVPPTDLFQYFDSVNPLDIISQFAEGMHPAYGMLMDFQAQEDYGDVNAPAPMNVVLTHLARAGFFDESQNGDVQIPYFLRTLTNAIAPFSNEYGDLGAGVGLQNEPTRLADLGIATEGDPDSSLVNALTAIGLTLGRGVGIQAKTPRDTASAAYRGQEELTRVVNEAFKNIPGFAEVYENS